MKKIATVKTRRVAGSVVISIPAEIMAAAWIKEGETVLLKAGDGELVVTGYREISLFGSVQDHLASLVESLKDAVTKHPDLATSDNLAAIGSAEECLGGLKVRE